MDHMDIYLPKFSLYKVISLFKYTFHYKEGIIIKFSNNLWHKYASYQYKNNPDPI